MRKIKKDTPLIQFKVDSDLISYRPKLPMALISLGFHMGMFEIPLNLICKVRERRLFVFIKKIDIIIFRSPVTYGGPLRTVMAGSILKMAIGKHTADSLREVLESQCELNAKGHCWHKSAWSHLAGKKY